MSNYTFDQCFCRSLQFFIILAEQFLWPFSNELILEERPDI